MSNRIVRAALTETINAYTDIPDRTDQLGSLKGCLQEIRRANVEHHVNLMRAARQQGVQVICFGELFPGPYFALGTESMWFDLAEDAETGITVREVSRAARDLEMIVVAPIYEMDRSGERFNTAVVIDEKGRFLGKFRKAHIPHGKNEQGAFHEMFYYESSDGNNGKTEANISRNPLFPVFETSIGNLGVAICYDRHFAACMWSLANEGAELVFSPAVTFGAKSQRMWHLEFPTDACRNNIFIGGSNRRGAERPWNQSYFGESYFVGPNGVLPNVSEHLDLVIADVDLDELERPDPAGWNLQRDIRHTPILLEPHS